MNGIPTYANFVAQIVQQTMLIFLLVGSVFAFVAGLTLVFATETAFRVAALMNRWVSTRAAIRPLEEHRSISRPLYRMHRLFGSLICAGAIYSLIVLGPPAGEAAIVKSLSGLGPERFSSWLSESLRYILLTGNFGALVFGAIFIARPSLLKSLEAWADRRISGRKATKPLEQLHLAPDRFVRANPRLSGVLIIAGSLYVVMNLGYALLR